MASYRITMKSDELYHWKYLDKYRKNGEWVYVYDEAKEKVKKAAKNVKKKASVKVGIIRKKASHAVYDTKKAVKSAYSNASKAANRMYKKAKHVYNVNGTIRKVRKAYDKAESAVNNVVKKVLNTVKPLIEKGASALRRVMNFFNTGKNTSTRQRISSDPRRESARVYTAKNTTITNSGITEYVRKGKKILMKALGKNTNTYRVDRLR